MKMISLDENPYIEAEIKEKLKSFDNYYFEGDIIKIYEIIKALKETLTQTSSIISKIHICYSIGTAFGDIQQLDYEHFTEDKIIQQLHFFRKAIDFCEDISITNEQQPYVNGIKVNLYTNYANVLSNIGRVSMAINYYRLALAMLPQYGMAEGNLGIAYICYGNIEFDKWRKQVFHHTGYSYLKSALSHKVNLYSGADQYFLEYIECFTQEYIDNVLEKGVGFNEVHFDDESECDYRNWVLEQRLFLNSLNDLPYIENDFAYDAIHLPSIVRKTSEGLDYKTFGMFNQLKQEYISARFLVYEASQSSMDMHFADKNTFVVDTLDYTIYSIRVEKLKLAFRSLYSLFDKIAYFINDYYDIGLPLKQIDFRRLWSNPKSKGSLLTKSNRMLNALYWISKEFFSEDTDDFASIKPTAKKIYEIRQELEHKYLKITEYPMKDAYRDSLAYYVTYQEFEHETKELLHLVREAIIYLSLSVYVNEEEKRKQSPNDVLGQIALHEYDDEWKQ
jgi:hypothetical protein